MAFWRMFIAAAWVGATAQAESFYAQINAAQTNVFLGQVFNVDVLVKAPTRPEAPVLDHLPGFNVTALDAGSATGKSGTYLFRYAFRATEAGKLTIPPLRFGSLSTDALVVQARKPVLSDRMKLTGALSASSVFQGEPVVLTTVWDSTYPFGALKAVDFNFPILNDPRFRVLEPYEPEKERQEQTTGLPVHGTRVLATRRSRKDGQVQHQSLSFRKILVPKTSGRLVIPPSTLLCAAEKGALSNPRKGRRNAFQYPAYFDNTFFDQNLSGGDYLRVYTESKPLELEAKPLPEKGRPGLFSGMVGDYALEVTAAPVSVRVGEAVTLTVTVTAARFAENIHFPPLRRQPGLISRFEIPEERSLPQRSGKSKIYTQSIRPLSTDIHEIPSLQLAYFSPASNAYITVGSPPIPLRVAPAESVPAYGAGAAPYRVQPHATHGGIRQGREASDLLVSRRPPLLGWTHPLPAALVVLLPPLLAAGAMLLGKGRRRVRRTARAARAYRVYRKNAARATRRQRTKSEIYGSLDRALRAYLGDRLHLNPGALSFREARVRLSESGADFQTLERLGELFVLCETYRFTPAVVDEPGNAGKIVRNANRVVKAVERSLR